MRGTTAVFAGRKNRLTVVTRKAARLPGHHGQPVLPTAKTAVVPRIVDERDVMAANSAVWTADTLADIAGYPLAGVSVYFLP